MTNGISVNDMVQVKASGEIGRVIAINDHTDRLPADLQVEIMVMHINVEEASKEIAAFYDANATMIPRAHHIASIMYKHVLKPWSKQTTFDPTETAIMRKLRVDEVSRIPDMDML